MATSLTQIQKNNIIFNITIADGGMEDPEAEKLIIQQINEAESLEALATHTEPLGFTLEDLKSFL